MPTAFFDKELYRLRETLAQMGGAVERMLDSALEALRANDAAAADQTILLDKAINDYDNRITNKAILLIATNQPVAGDLRFLAAALRLAAELERIGDLSANLCRRTRALASVGVPAPFPEELDELAVLARRMFGGALDALANRNPARAREILALDDRADELNRRIRQNMIEEIARDGPKIRWGLEIIYTAAHLERLADHATNLSEEVIYIYSGRNVRHCAGDSPPGGEGRPESRPETLAEGNRLDREDLED
ncbi:MAG: phosphate signaling complex protein PhoU [Candidatus Adiutrix sp.]|jgi:phosphate transport system protein|nr:phosphate signaling complex protein PhoU [Candidatus Adiutrix sp.]